MKKVFSKYIIGILLCSFVLVLLTPIISHSTIISTRYKYSGTVTMLDTLYYGPEVNLADWPSINVGDQVSGYLYYVYDTELPSYDGEWYEYPHQHTLRVDNMLFSTFPYCWASTCLTEDNSILNIYFSAGDYTIYYNNYLTYEYSFLSFQYSSSQEDIPITIDPSQIIGGSFGFGFHNNALFPDLSEFWECNFSGTIDSLTPAPVPEPATMLLFGSGLIGLASLRKMYKK